MTNMSTNHIKFDKKLTEKILPKFNNAKDWSDLMTIMKYLKENLKKYKDFNMTKMTEKVLLSKRLAQSLNPNLPDGLHEITIEVYDIIFENIRQNNNNYLGMDLGLYSSGLFPFFQFARMTNKMTYLNNIIKKHYLEISDQELTLCLSGFLVSILPGLEEQNDALIKLIKEIFTRARQKVGEATFFGILWTVILRTQRMRLAGMKYVTDSIQPYKVIEENFDLKEEYVQNFYPNLSVLVINALTSVIEDESVQVQRLALDFIITRLPINNKILEENQKIALIISGLNLLIKNDYSTTRRLFSWLMGNMEEDIEMGDPMIQYMIELVILSIKRIFDKNNYTKDKLSNGLKIIDQLFKQQVKLVDYVLESIAIDLINCVEDYFVKLGLRHSSEIKDEIVIKVKKFFDYDSAYLDCLWGSLSKLINKVEIDKNKNTLNDNTENNVIDTNSIIEENINTPENLKIENSNIKEKNLSEFNISGGDLFDKNNNITYDVDDVTKLLKFSLMYIPLESIEKMNKFYIPIVSNLLRALLNYKINNRENFGEIKALLVLASKFVQEMQDLTMRKMREKNVNNNSAEYNNNSNQYNNINKHSIKNILKQNEHNFYLLESFKENIILFQDFYVRICKMLLDNVNNNISKNTINDNTNLSNSNNRNSNERKTYSINYINDNLSPPNPITKENIKLFKKATELILITQEYSTQESLPLWVIYLVKIIFCHNTEFSLEGMDYFLDLLIINSENEVYSIIKYYLRSEELSEENLNFNNNSNHHTYNYKKSFFQTSQHSNCCELSMAKLWLLLDEQSIQKKVIDLLIKFFKAEPHVFSNTISNTFVINDLEQNVNAIKKFSQFWKLTSEYYPEIIFFENGECIFKMLDFLDHDHPLLRHLSKSWLSQSVGQFNKILDPLLKVLLDKETTWYISPKKQLYFAKEYDNRRIIEAFRKLKNIIINMTDLAITYFVNTQISHFLIEMDETGKELSSHGRSIPMEHYLEMMVSISLRFIQGKFIESVSENFYRENFSVNAASCEFLEFLLSFIEPKSKVMNIAEMIAEPVLMILHESIMSNDEVMQVQLLNLLKVLLFNTSNVHKEFIQQAVNIFNSQLLHDCITLGIQINYIFVRSHFISFVEYCLPIFRDILDLESNLRIAHKLIITTSDFLVRRVKYSINELTDQDSILNNNASKFFVVKNYLEEYKDYKTFDENDVHVIIKGLKEILFHFFSIDVPINNTEKINFQEFRKLLNAKTVLGSNSFKDYLGGLFSTKNFEENAMKKNTSEISLAIFGIFEDVLASFLCCWVSESENYMTKDLCLSENGILSYNWDDIKFQTLVNEGIVDNKNNNSNNNTQNSHFISNKHPLKTSKLLKIQIVNINLNIFMINPIEYMNKFLLLWLNEKNRYIQKDKQYKLSMIELLVSMNIPMEVLLTTIIKNINANKIKDYKKSKVKIRDCYPFYLNKEQMTYEASICHLIYSYIIFNTNLRVDKTVSDIWNEIINFMNIFIESKAPSTLFWTFEILNIMLHKLPIRETQITDKSIRHKLITIITILFTKSMDLAVNNKSEVIFEENSILILPLNPSIYEKVAMEIFDKDISKINHEKFNFNVNTNNNINLSPTLIKTVSDKNFNLNNNNNFKENLSDDSIRNFYHLIYDNVKNQTILKNEELLMAYRNIGFITLKTLFYSTMKNIYLPDKNDKLIPHVQAIVKNLIFIMNERIGVNKIYVDLATEFFHSLMMNASALVSNTCKNMIMEFFLEPEFFNMTKKCLRLWKDIIREFAHFYQDIIVDLFNTLNSSSFFSKGTDKFKIKALRRVSFILYSCNKDTYANKLPLILEKVKEVITTYTENPILESEIFLMIRIMFLRFSHENLVEMLRHLWPIIFSELVMIISNKKKSNPLDLILSSVKLIEELSLANMEEFCLYQWIFLIDTYDVNRMNPENEINLITSLLQSDSKMFRPFEMDLVKDFSKYVDLVSDINSMKFDEYQKRGLILQVQKLDSQEELSHFVSRLFSYAALMNNFRTKVDWDDVENVIETDFLNATL